jgi:hypothetical protein
MNPSIIEIHEFSTGINPRATADGGWMAVGFTGPYMNTTIDPVPDVVERAIANWEFALSEGASSDKPAIIGRVVGRGEDTWSVITVAIRGINEKDGHLRSFTAYRYFICRGQESDGFKNLRLILAWWESQQIPPRFNPFDIRELDKPNICDVNEVSTNFRSPSPEAITIPVNTPETILLPPEQQYDLQTINTLAFKKYNANKNGQPISWAFNVEALEKPERFLVIQAASTKAHQILQKAITSTPKVLAPVLTDEEALKSAIRGLMNSSQVKPENVKVIADALANNKITSEYWHTLFDGQGAKEAISQNIYSPQLVRLITLRAVVIPGTMLEFLRWLNIKPGQKPEEHQIVSLEFQKTIRRDLPQDKLANSIESILPELLKKSSIITPESVRWLLKSNDSAWAACYQEFINDVLYDLELIVNSLKDKTIIPSNFCRCDPQTWERLDSYKGLIYSSYASHKVEKYASFAKLFENLQEYQLSAYFYQVSQGIVPKKIFEKIPGGQNSYESLFLGLNLTREVTLAESVIEFLLQEYIVPIQVVIFLSLVLSIFSFTGGLIVGKSYSSIPGNSTPTQAKKEPNNSSSGSQNTVKGNNTNSKTTGSNTSSTVTSNSSQYNRIKASQNFQITRKALDQIITNTIQADKNKYEFSTNSREQIIKTIQVVLSVETVNYDNISSNEKDKMDFLDAIYEYQKNNISGSNNWDAIIAPKGKTATKLEEDVKNKLGLLSSPPPIR